VRFAVVEHQIVDQGDLPSHRNLHRVRPPAQVDCRVPPTYVSTSATLLAGHEQRNGSRRFDEGYSRGSRQIMIEDDEHVEWIRRTRAGAARW